VVALRQLAAGDTVSYGATWRAERPTTIATLAAGYADGIPRAAGRGQRPVELGGCVVPMVGRVAMDMIMVALPDDHAVAPGDIATIWGGLVSLDQQAEAAGTVAYELLTMLGTRVPRRYLTS
jgi:alanine racemase